MKIRVGFGLGTTASAGLDGAGWWSIVDACEELGWDSIWFSERLTMDVPDPHVRANQISTITNDGKVRFMTYTKTMTAALFLVFLSRLLRSTTGKVFLIVDRLRAHETPEVAQWVAAHRERIEVFYLPRYAPELNPDEYLNNDLKGDVNADGLPHNKGEVRSRIQGFMRKLLHLPEHVRSYFEHPCVRYAIGV